MCSKSFELRFTKKSKFVFKFQTYFSLKQQCPKPLCALSWPSQFFLSQQNLCKTNPSICQAHSAILRWSVQCHQGSERFVKPWELFLSFQMQWKIIWKKEVRIVVYIDQRLVVAHSKCWSKYDLSMFFN